jgi:glycosyltransferase involved in cell wall biosynthesis
VITPVKNEIRNLPLLVKSMMSQTVKPILWVFVDDCSIDGSKEYIQSLEDKYDFIKYVSTGFKDDGYNLDRYGVIIKIGIDYATKYCKLNNVTYHYLAIVDADMFLRSQYFEELIKTLEGDPELGIASGIILDKYENRKLVPLCDFRGDPVVVASAMLIRNECLASLGGFPTSIGPENVLMIKAKNRGWKIKCVKHVSGIHNRPLPPSLSVVWHKFVKSGETYYKLGQLPINAIVTAIYHIIWRAKEGLIDIRVLVCGLAYLAGYFASLISRKDKLKDQEIINFYNLSWRSLFGKIIHLFILHLRSSSRKKRTTRRVIKILIQS